MHVNSEFWLRIRNLQPKLITHHVKFSCRLKGRGVFCIMSAFWRFGDFTAAARQKPWKPGYKRSELFWTPETIRTKERGNSEHTIIFFHILAGDFPHHPPPLTKFHNAWLRQATYVLCVYLYYLSCHPTTCSMIFLQHWTLITFPKGENLGIFICPGCYYIFKDDFRPNLRSHQQTARALYSCCLLLFSH